MGQRASLECRHPRGNREVKRVVGAFGEIKQCGEIKAQNRDRKSHGIANGEQMGGGIRREHTKGVNGEIWGHFQKEAVMAVVLNRRENKNKTLFICFFLFY